MENKNNFGNIEIGDLKSIQVDMNFGEKLDATEIFGIRMILAILLAVIVFAGFSMYITSMTSNKKFGIGMFIFLSGIYAILFSILRMEQYALLTGTLLILAVLYVVMYLTKKADIFFKLEEENNQ